MGRVAEILVGLVMWLLMVVPLLGPLQQPELDISLVQANPVDRMVHSLKASHSEAGGKQQNA